MGTELTWLGHGGWSIRTGDYRVLLDPFLDDNPTAPFKADAAEADFILVSHGHFDHTGDVERIAKRTAATVISNFEICEWFSNRGVAATHAMNIGGAHAFPFGRVKLTIAQHTSMMPDGSYGGVAAGFLVSFPEGNVYFACDTGLFYDMTLIGLCGLEIAVLPIGDNFTMGPQDALAATQMLHPQRVIPVHANTWPVIDQDMAAWADAVKRQSLAIPLVLSPGESVAL